MPPKNNLKGRFFIFFEIFEVIFDIVWEAIFLSVKLVKRPLGANMVDFGPQLGPQNGAKIEVDLGPKIPLILGPVLGMIF